ncbi:MAG: glycoside hydrolase family 15 protein [Dehalococcoidia bacterium]|nr:MAG: glycoside hydrolase family 15 protein [Dehalococcoidia bacterium]
MPYRRISEYGVIGDMHSAALVSRDGSIDWLCFPRFDSPSVFAAVVDDAQGGYFRIRPVGDFRCDHSYIPDSNVLVADFRTDSGAATLTDFMPVADEITHCDHELVRVVRCQSGSMEMEVEFKPRLDYARSPTAISVNGRSVVARGNGDCLSMTAGAPLEPIDGGAHARFTLREGQWTAFLLRWNDDSPPLPEEYDVHGRLGRTQAFWQFVAHDWRYMGRWEELVKRSMLALHLLLYVPTGAVCAAVTTSLPERIGGSRNWDYRFCWLRDAAFSLDIFHRLGHTACTRPFIEWLAELALGFGHGEDIHSLYEIGCEADPHGMSEEVLGHLEGYRSSGPVRVGNAAFHQFQLDVYGEVLLSFDSYHRAGGIIDDSLWVLAETMVESALRNWQKADKGIWEVRSEPKHFTYSKLMAWAAVDRGLRLAKALKRPVDFERWRRAREAMRADILEKSWNENRRSFVQAYGADNLDASALFIPMVGFLPADDPRMAATIEAVQKELGRDGFVYRYLPSQTDDGVDGDEGAFTMCSLWLASSMITGGRLDEARAIFERVVGLGNQVGLYSEMVDPRTGEFLGNYPQAFTHIALIHTARNLDRALNQVELGKVVAA